MNGRNSSHVNSLRIVILCLLLPFLQMQGQQVGELLDQTGLFLELDQGGSINVRIDKESKTMRVYELDAQGLVMKPSFARALVLIDPPRDTKEWRLVLRPAQDGPFLTHPRLLHPPYVYRVRVFLYPNEDSDEGRVALPKRAFKQL